MPWKTGKAFASAHNKKLRGVAATTAAKQASAMIRGGTPEGIAIATANKTGNRMQTKSRKNPLYDHPRSPKKK